MTKKGTWIGICIKFALYDRTTKTTHWSVRDFDAFMKALEQYINALGSNAFMLRASADPALVKDLAERHPYNTLLSEKPALSDEEVGTPTMSSGILDVAFIARGTTFELRADYGDGRTGHIFLHEYTAFSLFGYLEEYIAAAKTLSGPAAGHA